MLSRRGSPLPPRFESLAVWEVEAWKLAPMSQTLHGCVAVRRRSWQRGGPPDLDWWRPDVAELQRILITKILPAASRASPALDANAGFQCGVDLRCGTHRGYNEGGRCRWCRRARRFWADNRGQVFECGTDPRCGTGTGHAAGGRCDQCREARRLYQNLTRARSRASFDCSTDPRCGSKAGYKAGGRCDQCRDIHATESRRLRAKFECGADPRCGTATGYYAGGRCDQCREAIRQVNRNMWNAKKQAQG